VLRASADIKRETWRTTDPDDPQPAQARAERHRGYVRETYLSKLSIAPGGLPTPLMGGL
jgi:hypothetical protein